MLHPNNPKVVRVTMVFQTDTRVINNVFHWERNAPWTAADMNFLAGAVKNWWSGQYAANCSASVALVAVQVRLYDPLNPLAVDLLVTPNIPGGVSGTPLAANATLSMSARTGLAGRQYRGRFYVARLAQSNVTSLDQINSGLAAALVVTAQAFFTIGNTTGSAPCIWHRLTNTFTDTTSILIDANLDSQRRRLPGRGI